MSLKPPIQAISRASFDLIKVEKDEDLDKVIERLNLTIEYLNYIMKSLSFSANFNGYVATATIPATSSVKIQHFLGVKPKYRLILNQTGNGVITDIPSEWTDKVISLYNNGASEVTVTLLIARE
jgi:hypothetical protein